MGFELAVGGVFQCLLGLEIQLGEFQLQSLIKSHLFRSALVKAEGFNAGRILRIQVRGPGRIRVKRPGKGILRIIKLRFGGDDVLLPLGRRGLGAGHFDRSQCPHLHANLIFVQLFLSQGQRLLFVFQIPLGENQVPILGFRVGHERDDGLLEDVVRLDGTFLRHDELGAGRVATRIAQKALGVGRGEAAGVGEGIQVVRAERRGSDHLACGKNYRALTRLVR